MSGKILEDALALVARINDTPDGFAAYFELMHGKKLRPGAFEWVELAYQALVENKGFLNEVHREGAKTETFAKHFLSFRIGHEPEKTNLIIRINGEKADQTTSTVSSIIEFNEKWKKVFPHIVPDKTKGWGAKGYFVKRMDIEYADWINIRTMGDDYPTFVGYGWDSGSIVGSRVSGICLIDDIVDTKTVKSEADMQAIENLVKEVLTLTIKRGAWEIWNFTPYAFNDIYQDRKATGNYIHNLSPVMTLAKEGDEGATFWPEDEYVPLSGSWWVLAWPAEWDFERLAKKYKDIGQVRFARQMLLDLTAMSGNTLRGEWIRYFPADKIDLSWPVFLGIDYASVSDKLKTAKRDYFTLSIFRGMPGGGIVIVGGLRAHLTKKEGLDALARYSDQHNTLQLVGVESLGKGEEFYNDALLLRDIQGGIYPLMKIQHGRKSKGERFEDWLAPRFESGRIWVTNAPDPFITEFINEWLLWPNAQHDDCLDAVYMGAVAAEGNLYDRTRPTERTKTTNIFKDMVKING